MSCKFSLCPLNFFSLNFKLQFYGNSLIIKTSFFSQYILVIGWVATFSLLAYLITIFVQSFPSKAGVFGQKKVDNC